MTTNFFQNICALQAHGDWRITISADKDNKLIVSVLLSNGKVDDAVAKQIPPMLLKGTAEELDNGFFDSIQAPIEQTSQLFANMEQYMKTVEETKKQSKMEKNKAQTENKEQDERKKKYDGMIKKVDELEEAKKYQEAIAHLPKAEQFPEQAEEIKKRLEALRKANGQLSLL